jgi:hypothetical protein
MTIVFMGRLIYNMHPTKMAHIFFLAFREVSGAKVEGALFVFVTGFDKVKGKWVRMHCFSLSRALTRKKESG